jgi:transposase-like protein
MKVMQHSVLDAKHFHDEEAAYAYLEAKIWPEGPVCPHCGGVDRISKMQGKSTRVGMYKCYQCRKPFRATVGTVFEASHVPLRLWLQAVHLMASSKKGFSANQLHRVLNVTLRTAWFMMHRIREAMSTVGVEPMGGAGKVVEVDETYIGFQDGANTKTPRIASQYRNVVLTLVERGGVSRSFHIDGTTIATLGTVMRANINRESTINTDEANWYRRIGREFANHLSVNHKAYEYSVGDITTNRVEGFFSIFKRGMKGVYQHCSERHLHRYLAEFDFRYSNRIALGVNDVARADRALKGIVGKRLTYRTSHV